MSFAHLAVPTQAVAAPSRHHADATRPALPVDLQALVRSGSRGDALTPVQRGGAVAAIVGAHLVGLWALMQVDAVRDVVRESAPLFVAWIAPPTPPAPVVTPPAPVPPARMPPQPPRTRPPTPILTAAPRPNASPAEVAPALAPAPVEPSSLPVAAAPAAQPIVAPPAPAPAPVAAPTIIPPSAVDYLVEPAPAYPRLSSRAGESGRVLVLVYIDEGGLPKQVQVARSSGFPRLDAAAVAAVQKARFRPPTLNGQSISGWANVPIDFGLEK